LESFEWRARARGRIIVSIDPRQPLEPQFTAIRKELTKPRSRARARTDTYELALRLLDARSTDRQQQPPTWREIESLISKEHGRKHLTSLHLQRKRYEAIRLQQRFLQPLYQLPIKKSQAT
jgi:hypothetical protein